MEVFSHRRSKSASSTGLAHCSSGGQGDRLIQNQRSSPNLASNSSSYSSGTIEEDTLTFELGWRSSKQAVGTPMKKLLAEEMSRETEFQKRAPSLVARLMGLEGMPPQQPTHKQPNRSLEKDQPKVASVDKTQRNGSFSGRRSFRKSSKDEQEFKDVFEVLETSKPGSSGSSFRESSNSKLTDAEMAFIKQKFMDAKYLSIDEKLQDSKEFHHAVEALDSNKNLLLKYLHQPDSLFTKHLCDLQSTPQTHCSHLAAMRSSGSPNHERSSLGLKERETAWKNHNKHPQKHRDLSSDPRTRHVSRNSPKIQLEEKSELAVTPTRIVVLKPNLGKTENVAKAVPSYHSSHAFPSDSRKHTQLPCMKNSEAELLGKRNFSDDMGHSRYKSRESRDIAKEITRQMKNSFNMGTPNFSSSGFRGYAGDESSNNMSGNESMYDSEASAVTSRNSIDWTNRNRASSSRATESSVSREAKKRLSERWKMTHKSQEVGGTRRGNTLGEMLAIPDKEASPEILDPMIREEKFSDKFARNERPSGWVEPLGISSRDGWKDGCITNLSRSGSLLASPAALGSPKTSMHCETVCHERYLIPKEALKQERNKLVKGNCDQRDVLRPRNSRSIHRRSQSSRRRGRGSDTSTETNFSLNQVEIKLEENDPFIEDLIISVNTRSDPDDVVDVGQKNAATSVRCSDLDLSARLLVVGNSSVVDLENPIPQDLQKEPSEEVTVALHHPVPDVESPASSKEADQPSPLSVLDAPFTDDPLSGSECFESLSADLNGLRMQLQLLKSGSESYEEGIMTVSSDEEEPVALSKEKGLCSSMNWESSYIHDVLTQSGFSNTGRDTFLATCHSPDCPVSPSVFERLEKVYHDQTSCLRPDRKLLFDRINAGLLEIYRKYGDPDPWARTSTTCGALKWTREGPEGSLYELLENQEQEANQETMENGLGIESGWLDFGDENRVVGREIERMLINELVAELVMDM